MTDLTTEPTTTKENTNMTTTNHPLDFHAWINNGNDLERVDLRTLPSDKLERLSSEAGAAGDLDMVAAIDVILARRHR